MGNIDKNLFDDLMSFVISKKSSSSKIIVNHRLIGEYSQSLLNDIDYALYNAAMNKKVTAYFSEPFNNITTYTIAGLRKQCQLCGPISVQIDPKDPYNTKDSTICGDFNEIPAEIGVEIYFNKGNNGDTIHSIVPVDLSSRGQRDLFFLRAEDALNILKPKLDNFLIDVALYKLGLDSW